MTVKVNLEEAQKGMYALRAGIGAVSGVLGVSMQEAQASLFRGLVCDIMHTAGEEKLRAAFDQLIAFYKRNKEAVETLEKGADAVIIT